MRPDGRRYRITRSNTGEAETHEIATGGIYRVTYDRSGRVTSVKQGDRSALRRQWGGDGQLAWTASETSGTYYRHDPDGNVTGALFTQPENLMALESGAKIDRWLDVSYNDRGLATDVKDQSGMRLVIERDDAGRPVGITSNRARVQIQRNRVGKVTGTQTSWGRTSEVAYDKSGAVKRVTVRQGDAKRVVEFNDGKAVFVRQYDGAAYRVAYFERGPRQDLIDWIAAPNGLELKYDYGDDGRLLSVQCGDVYQINYKYDEQGRLTALAYARVAD